MPPTSPSRTTPIRLVIVDDHDTFRAAASALLSAEGFTVVGEAATARTGLDLVRAGAPDLVLVDVGLPDEDGFELASRLRDDERSCPVVLTSSRGAAEYGRLVAACGARGFVPKEALCGEALRHAAGF